MKYRFVVRAWLYLGFLLLFFQIIIGGITRITGSGLSITKWEIITGTFPPTTESQWVEEFDKYKETPQYKKINKGMEMGSIMTAGTFKFIYFWEYFHRLWARMMGFVFLFPLLFFIYKKWVDKRLLKQLAKVFFAAALAAVFGWIMVASGLRDRPWVNAYKLSLHLGIALLTLGFLLWAIFMSSDNGQISLSNHKFRKWTRLFFYFLCLQIFFGAVVSGMRAALYYPTWPAIGQEMIPSLLFDAENWSVYNLVNYDHSPLMPALIHVLHRNLGYIVFFMGCLLVYKILRYPFPKKTYYNNLLLLFLLVFQVFLGIMTLLKSSITVPVFYGVMHQAIAIFIFSVSLYNIYLFRIKSTKGTNG